MNNLIFFHMGKLLAQSDMLYFFGVIASLMAIFLR